MQSLLEWVRVVGLVVGILRIHQWQSATGLSQCDEAVDVLVGFDEELRVLGVILEAELRGWQTNSIVFVPRGLESDAGPGFGEVDVDEQSRENVLEIIERHEESTIFVIVQLELLIFWQAGNIFF